MAHLLTSAEAPLRIDPVPVEPGAGWLGLTLCPGKRDGHLWARDLDLDLAVIHAWGASTVVTLLEPAELDWLGVADLGERVRALAMHWWHLPIRDGEVPDARFTARWPEAGADLHGRLDRGERLLVHCRGGLGRTGLVSALLLIERGEAPEQAIARVREIRPGAIETAAQEHWVRRAGVRR